MKQITLKINNKIIKWIFGYVWDYEIQTKYTLPWALNGIEYEQVSDSIKADFVICVYVAAPSLPEGIEYNDLCFFISGEKHDRFNKIPNCFQFCQDPLSSDDAQFTRYAPSMCHWVPVQSPIKNKLCSVVDSGKWSFRRNLIENVRTYVDVELFGAGTSRPLKGWHKEEINEKYLGLTDYAFYLSIENSFASDYITEKLWDAYLCECMPVYFGATNISDYLIDGSYVPLEKVHLINWYEYSKSFEKIMQQKEFIRTHLNIFNYFRIIIENLKLLDNIRPITLNNFLLI